MARYQITSPDGQNYEITAPDEASQEQVLSYAKEQFSQPKEAQPKEAQPEASVADKIAASPIAQFFTGAASPIMGAASLIEEGTFGTTGGRERAKALEEMETRGGSGGAGGVAKLAGTVLSPAFLAAAKLAPAASYGGRVLQGGELGALAGLTAPKTDEGSRLDMGAVGAGVGGVIPALAPVVAGVGKGLYHAGIEPWLNNAAIKGRAFLEAAGDKADDIIRLLKENKQIVPGAAPTAGEAAVPAASAEFSALQKGAERVLPSRYLAWSDAQNAARLEAIKSVGQTPEALRAAQRLRSENASKNYGAVRNDLINPKADTEIMEDAIASRLKSKGEALRDWGRFSTTASQQENLAHGGVITKTAGGSGNVSTSSYPVEGYPRIPGRYTANIDRVPEAQSAAKDAMVIAQFRQKQAEYLKNAMASLKETVGLDDVSFNYFARRPSMKAAVEDALLSAQESGVYFPAASGEKFSVGNLQRIKESLDSGIRAAKNAENAGRRPELSAAELTNTKDSFVKWLSNKSPAWREARLAYSKESGPINQMEVGQFLEKKLVPALGDEAKQKASTYAQALRDAEGTIKKATGGPRFESLDKVLTSEQLKVVNSVRDDLARGARFEDMAKRGTSNIGDIASESMEREFGGRFPNILHRGAMIANAVVRRLEGKINKKLAVEIAADMLNPPKVGESIEQALARQKKIEIMSSAIMQYRPAAVAGTISASQ